MAEAPAEAASAEATAADLAAEALAEVHISADRITTEAGTITVAGTTGTITAEAAVSAVFSVC